MQEENKTDLRQKVSRNTFLDLTKGVLILLVLLGHTIQYASGKAYLSQMSYFDCWAFKLIYGFHMPLFMVISGYLFYYSIKSKKALEIVWGRLRTLVVPIFSFAFIVWLLHFNSDYSFFDQIRNYLSRTRYTLWFLWALFYCSMGVLLVHLIAKDNVIVCIALVLLSYLTPDKWFSELYKFMYPCFLFGYFAHKYNWTEFFKKNIKVVAGVATALYVLAMFAYYDVNTYVYISGSCVLKDGMLDWHQFFINVYRTLVGICGSVAFVSVLYVLNDLFPKNSKLEHWIVALGTMTMGIYCFQNYFWILYSNYIDWTLKPIILNQWLVFLVSLAVSYLVTVAVKHIKLLNVLFLGGR